MPETPTVTVEATSIDEAEPVWNTKRKKVSDYLATMRIVTADKPSSTNEHSPPQPDIGIDEVLAKAVDHDGSRFLAGAEAIQKHDRLDSYKRRVTEQLETARQLGRNESLMKVPIYLDDSENSPGDDFVTAWEAIPKDKKKRARKKMMLGMAITSRSLSPLFNKLKNNASK